MLSLSEISVLLSETVGWFLQEIECVGLFSSISSSKHTHTHTHTHTDVKRIADFLLIFNDHEFPIRWQKEYIRLLTTFEVAVELGNGELLIPSALHSQKPNLPQTMFPEELVSYNSPLHFHHRSITNGQPTTV